MKQTGFTLAELLIALAILGVIATFTIPKVLQSQQNSQWKSSAKEAVAMLSGAYQAYQSKNTLSASTLSSDLTPYMNYVRLVTTGTIDHVTGQSTLNCSDTANQQCIALHSGAIMDLPTGNSFGVGDASHYIFMFYDPDGRYSGNTTGPGKSMVFDLHYNGRVTSSDQRQGSDVTFIWGTPETYGPDPVADWFSWN